MKKLTTGRLMDILIALVTSLIPLGACVDCNGATYSPRTASFAPNLVALCPGLGCRMQNDYVSGQLEDRFGNFGGKIKQVVWTSRSFLFTGKNDWVGPRARERTLTFPANVRAVVTIVMTAVNLSVLNSLFTTKWRTNENKSFLDDGQVITIAHFVK